MKKIFFISFIILATALSSCKTCIPVVEYRDSVRTIEVRVRDTAIITKADSASLQLLLRCDSANNVLIDEVTNANGERLSLQMKLQRLINGQSKLDIQCREDSLLQIIQLQDSIINTMTHQTIVQQVEIVPKFYRGCTIALWILVALLAIGVTIRILIRVYLKK